MLHHVARSGPLIAVRILRSHHLGSCYIRILSCIFCCLLLSCLFLSFCLSFSFCFLRSGLLGCNLGCLPSSCLFLSFCLHFSILLRACLLFGSLLELSVLCLRFQEFRCCSL